jgi:hypothetical protein
VTYYKVLVDGRSCFGGTLEWSLPTERSDGTWEPGGWMEVSGPVELCYRGLHLTADPYGRWATRGMSVFEAEPGEIADRKQDKVVTDRARLLRPVPHPVWWEETVRLVDIELATTRWFRPDGVPDSRWRVFTASTWNEAADACIAAIEEAGEDPFGDPHRARALEEAVAAADGAGRAIPRQIANGIAIDRALGLARRAAWAARDREGNAPMEEAQDAADFIHDFVVIRGICADLPIAAKHREVFETEWEVYRKGYVPLKIVDGQRYVYTKQRRRAATR